MTHEQEKWARSRDKLAAAVVSLGYPEELAGVLVKQLKSPGAIDRMSAYLSHARPGNLEMIVDEMLAICAGMDAWRERRESREAWAEYNTRLSNDSRRQNEEKQEEK